MIKIVLIVLQPGDGHKNCLLIGNTGLNGRKWSQYQEVRLSRDCQTSGEACSWCIDSKTAKYYSKKFTPHVMFIGNGIKLQNN